MQVNQAASPGAIAPANLQLLKNPSSLSSIYLLLRRFSR